MSLDCEVRLVWQPVSGGAWLAPLRVPIKNDCYVSRDDAEWNREGGIVRALVGTLAPSAVEIVPCSSARVLACRADEHDTAAVRVDVSLCDDQPPVHGRIVFALVQNGRRRGRDGGAWRVIDETPCRYDGCECGLKEAAIQVRPEVLEVVDGGALLRVGLQFNEVSSHRAANPDSTRSFSDYEGVFTGFLWLRATWIADDNSAQPAVHRLCTAGPLITLEKFGNKYRNELAAVDALHLLGKRTRSRVPAPATGAAGRVDEEDGSDPVPPPPALPSTDEWASAIVPRQPRAGASTLPFCVSVSLMRRVLSSHEQRAEDWHMVTERTAPTLLFGTLHEPTQTNAVCCLDVEFSRRVRNTSSSRRFRCMTIDTIVPVCIARWWDGSKIAAAADVDHGEQQQLMVELCWPQQSSFDDPQFDAAMPLQYSEPYRVVVQCAPDADGPWSVLPVHVAACAYSDRDTVRIPVDVSAFRYAPVYFRVHVSNGDAEQFVNVPSVLYGDCLDKVPLLSAAVIASDRVTTLLPCCEGYEVVEAQPSPPPAPPPVPDTPTTTPAMRAKRGRAASNAPKSLAAAKRAKTCLPASSSASTMDEFLDARRNDAVDHDASNVEAAERDALRAIARYYRAQYLRATTL